MQVQLLLHFASRKEQYRAFQLVFRDILFKLPKKIIVPVVESVRGINECLGDIDDSFQELDLEPRVEQHTHPLQNVK